ncbi:MAG: FeoA family protein [Pseudomonadales bacterium]|jgi:Fe2+ transport system protein FeoA
MTLADVAALSSCRILEAATEQLDIQSRLYALGLYPGVEVKVLRFAPMGDPIQLKVGNALLSIRKQEARYIRVEGCE